MPRDFQSIRLRPIPDRRRMADRRAEWRGQRRARSLRVGTRASVSCATGDASNPVEGLARARWDCQPRLSTVWSARGRTGPGRGRLARGGAGAAM